MASNAVQSTANFLMAAEMNEQHEAGRTSQVLDEYICTPKAAMLMNLSAATLRNYSWLNTLSPEERVARKLQDPPAGLPVPVRNRGRLMWPLAMVTEFVHQKSRQVRG